MVIRDYDTWVFSRTKFNIYFPFNRRSIHFKRLRNPAFFKLSTRKNVYLVFCKCFGSRLPSQGDFFPNRVYIWISYVIFFSKILTS